MTFLRKFNLSLAVGSKILVKQAIS